LGVGAGFFVDVNFVERPVEFIRAVVCLDRDSGETLWTCEGLRGQEAGGESRVVTHASATPVTDGERIYGYFGKDGLMCVSPEGKLLWKKTEPMFHSKFGVGTSPVVKDNVLIVVSDERESDKSSSSITAFDCLSGERLWEKERKSHKVDAGYSTPLVKSLNGREVVIVHGWYDIKGYDLETGQELWSYPMAHEGRHLVASLVSDAERLYVTGANQIFALDIAKLRTVGDPLLWSTGVPGEKSSTPVVVDGLLFLVTETGTAYCLDAKTGEVLWKEHLEGRYFSSVVATANKVFLTNESGQTTVVAIDREFRQLARDGMGESVYASFVPTGNQLFVRTSECLYCIQEDKQ
jgi:outer membrane protein assembly factor BamB